MREQLADLRVEITTGIAEAASIPWELMRDPQSDSPIALRVAAFVRVQSNPNISFVPRPPAPGMAERVRLLYVVCRPNGSNDVALRAVANRLLARVGQGPGSLRHHGPAPAHLRTVADRVDRRQGRGRPYHIVHFDGHGIYADLSGTTLAGWLGSTCRPCAWAGRTGASRAICSSSSRTARRGCARWPAGSWASCSTTRACPSWSSTPASRPCTRPRSARQARPADVHDEVRAIGSLAQAVIDQGIPGVLGMRYSVFVVTAAQYIGELYAGLGKGRSFG